MVNKKKTQTKFLMELCIGLGKRQNYSKWHIPVSSFVPEVLWHLVYIYFLYHIVQGDKLCCADVYKKRTEYFSSLYYKKVVCTAHKLNSKPKSSNQLHFLLYFSFMYTYTYYIHGGFTACWVQLYFIINIVFWSIGKLILWVRGEMNFQKFISLFIVKVFD